MPVITVELPDELEEDLLGASPSRSDRPPQLPVATFGAEASCTTACVSTVLDHGPFTKLRGAGGGDADAVRLWMRLARTTEIRVVHIPLDRPELPADI